MFLQTPIKWEFWYTGIRIVLCLFRITVNATSWQKIDFYNVLYYILKQRQDLGCNGSEFKSQVVQEGGRKKKSQLAIFQK